MYPETASNQGELLIRSPLFECCLSLNESPGMEDSIEMSQTSEAGVERDRRDVGAPVDPAAKKP
eukprot:COSAG02_NODE_417_length_22746_cov_9.074172_4_plen_64_part_00